jgi:hypothetical protein
VGCLYNLANNRHGGVEGSGLAGCLLSHTTRAISNGRCGFKKGYAPSQVEADTAFGVDSAVCHNPDAQFACGHHSDLTSGFKVENAGTGGGLYGLSQQPPRPV